ncbi:MAG: hypothetical protein GY834_14650 [Bacteroidetes bacterium]|nr:hypothetical protein [Bacteroidota bacterium]
MRRFFNILIWTILVLGVTAVIFVVIRENKEVLFKEMIISINYPEGDVFISENQVESIIFNADSSIYSNGIYNVKTNELEKLIEQNAYVNSAEVSTTIDGKLIVNVDQRQPIFRVESGKESFYVDNYGNLLPLSPDYVSRVVIVNGHIKNIDFKEIKEISFSKENDISGLKDIFFLIKYIRNDAFLKALIEQIYVNRNKEIELIPKIGNQVILFGKIENIEEKLQNLQLFYTQGMEINGWGAYKVINVKFSNQVVCTKI